MFYFLILSFVNPNLQNKPTALSCGSDQMHSDPSVLAVYVILTWLKYYTKDNTLGTD